jgi:mannose-6-phosphate isomerase-like protein (cupin superfamily)
MPERYRVERWNSFGIPNSAMLRYTLETDGFDVFQWSDRPGITYGLHKHPEEQSHWIVSGQLEIYVKDVGTFLLGPGDRDFMPGETYHSARVIGVEPVVYVIGIKKPAPTKTPKRMSAAKPKPATKPPVQQRKPAAKPPKTKTATKKKTAAKHPSSGKPSKRSKKKA